MHCQPTALVRIAFYIVSRIFTYFVLHYLEAAEGSNYLSQCLPQFSPFVRLSDYSFKIPDTISLGCNFFTPLTCGIDQGDVSWYKIEDMDISPLNKTVGQVLQVTVVKKSQLKVQYQCLVKNSVGAISRIFSMSKSGPFRGKLEFQDLKEAEQDKFLWLPTLDSGAGPQTKYFHYGETVNLQFTFYVKSVWLRPHSKWFFSVPNPGQTINDTNRIELFPYIPNTGLSSRYNMTLSRIPCGIWPTDGICYEASLIIFDLMHADTGVYTCWVGPETSGKLNSQMNHTKLVIQRNIQLFALPDPLELLNQDTNLQRSFGTTGRSNRQPHSRPLAQALDALSPFHDEQPKEKSEMFVDHLSPIRSDMTLLDEHNLPDSSHNLLFNKNTTVCMGTNFTLHCSLKPPISNGSVHLLYVQESEGFHSATSEHIEKLTIKRIINESSCSSIDHTFFEVNEEHAGWYVCMGKVYDQSEPLWQTMYLKPRRCVNSSASTEARLITSVLSFPGSLIIFTVLCAVSLLVSLFALCGSQGLKKLDCGWSAPCISNKPLGQGTAVQEQLATKRSPLLKKKVHVYRHPNHLYTGTSSVQRGITSLLDVKIDEGYDSQIDGTSDHQTPCHESRIPPQVSNGARSMLACLNFNKLRDTENRMTSSQTTHGNATDKLTLYVGRSPDPKTKTAFNSELFKHFSWPAHSRTVQGDAKDNAVLVECETSKILYELPVDESWELPRDCIRVGRKLGQGAFGVVYYGRLDLSRLRNSLMERFPANLIRPEKLKGNYNLWEVAVKRLRSDFVEQELIDLVREMEMMKLLGSHPHLIRFYGACTQSWPFQVVVEYAPHGNLRDFLRARRPPKSTSELNRLMKLPHPTLNRRNLLDYGLQVARGMEYLSLRSVVHRDLAARNVLVGEQFVVKIADFGLTRTVSDYYRKTTSGRLPIKWMSPESLFDRTYTTKSDVWSFGVLLWEIFALGAVPYPSIAPERLPSMLNQGHRNDCPKLANKEIYEIMKWCWTENPDDRPEFSTISLQLEKIKRINNGWFTDYPINGLNEENSADSGQASAESLERQLRVGVCTSEESSHVTGSLHTSLQCASSLQSEFPKSTDDCSYADKPLNHYLEMTDNYLIPRTSTASLL
ncbi:Fibroblast growth factor receptor 1 [Clonorchis sinensis]|uniref:Fibroblast growth factor receptor 1 n=1 Tax=Clonorchis sinensis TaxID=79923 RepID=A0A8T1MHI6_CLOSI|nr:Fibroblast growth factor receptor 1 [Clonorchis sinensis]